MSDPAEMYPYNRFLITACHLCATPKYNPGDEIWNGRGQRKGKLWDNSRLTLVLIIGIVVAVIHRMCSNKAHIARAAPECLNPEPIM